MVVCGISGRGRHAAAAIAIDGRLVSAVEQAAVDRLTRDPRGAHWPLAAIDACRLAAGLKTSDIGQFAWAHRHEATLECARSLRRIQIGHESVRGLRVSRLAAFARLAKAAGARAVLVADGPAAMVVAEDGTASPLDRASGLLSLACRLATSLGRAHDDSAGAVAALEQLAASYEPSGRDWFEDMAVPVDDGSASVDAAAFESALALAASEAGAPLADTASPLVRKARVVADVADAFLAVVAAHFGQLAQAAGPTVMLAGGLFGSPDFVSRVRRAAGRPCGVAPCSSTHGAALGAALTGAPIVDGALPSQLALGPLASEAEAKAVLENCRLDYLYEPRWPRLLQRVSRLLERGKLVAWFQGRAEFGHPFNGSRSFLCDPSNRYARDNINAFLLRRPVSAPIPISLAPDAQDCVDPSAMSPLTLTRTAVGEDWRDRLRAAIDSQGYAHAHVVHDRSALLAELLLLHRQRTGVPGLANLPLRAADDVTALSPRDAIRAAFASSADALVMHRFVVMKDYWQLRDETMAQP
jgi:predicted NodU family carbamoyl transferase